MGRSKGLKFIVNEGLRVKDGNPEWPDALHVHFSDPEHARDLVEVLLKQIDNETHSKESLGFSLFGQIVSK